MSMKNSMFLIFYFICLNSIGTDENIFVFEKNGVLKDVFENCSEIEINNKYLFCKLH